MSYGIGFSGNGVATTVFASRIIKSLATHANDEWAKRGLVNQKMKLAAAEDTAFGLSAGIVTTSLRHAEHFKRNSSAGMVMVNLPTAGVDYHVPFGGNGA